MVFYRFYFSHVVGMAMDLNLNHQILIVTGDKYSIDAAVEFAYRYIIY